MLRRESDKDEALIDHAEISFGKTLGQGGFGVVYQGTWQHNDVAIKQLLMNKITPESEQEFQTESRMMASLRSPNIVQFYGYAMSPHYCIVMEYCPNGSLFSVLHSDKPLAWPLRSAIALDAAKGLAFLHNKNIFHRDIKSLNVLLNKHYEAKLTDFGLSKVKAETKSHTIATKTNSSVGTLQWMAPELFEPDGVFTKKSDVYSLGVTFWELASRKIPFEKASSPLLVPMWVGKGKREGIPLDCPAELGALIQACWDGDEQKRPDANAIVVGLKSIVESLAAAAASTTTNTITTTNSMAPADKVSPMPTVSGPQYLGNESMVPAKSSPQPALVPPSPEAVRVAQLERELQQQKALAEENQKAKAALEAAQKIAEKEKQDRDEQALAERQKQEFEKQQEKQEQARRFAELEKSLQALQLERDQQKQKEAEAQQKILAEEKLKKEAAEIQKAQQKALAEKQQREQMEKERLQKESQAREAEQRAIAERQKLQQEEAAREAQKKKQPTPVALAAFLKLVAEGEQDKAEALLKSEPSLALHPSNVTDLSGRSFLITGFQYAVWALDFHMWTMIKKYMRDEDIKTQVEALDKGEWVKQHGASANWQNLVLALNEQLGLLQAKKWAEAEKQWHQSVGGAQRQLPVHVVNQYCHPSRSFEVCPDFRQDAVLPRTRNTTSGDWYTASYNGGQLGEKFAVCRGTMAKANAIDHTRWGVPSVSIVMKDSEASRALLQTRTEQREELLSTYAPNRRAVVKN